VRACVCENFVRASHVTLTPDALHHGQSSWRCFPVACKCDADGDVDDGDDNDDGDAGGGGDGGHDDDDDGGGGGGGAAAAAAADDVAAPCDLSKQQRSILISSSNAHSVQVAVGQHSLGGEG